MKYNSKQHLSRLLCILLALWGVQLNAQTTAIPDPIFEQQLIDKGIDSDGIINGQILTSDALGVYELQMDSVGLNSLEGIEAFVDLGSLYCRQNNLRELNLYNSPNLNNLHCDRNQIEYINVSSTSSLSVFGCGDNRLLHIDVSNSPNITYLWTRGNLPGLRICVHDVNAPQAGGWVKDWHSTYTDDCFPRAVEGRVAIDLNNNCQPDANEIGVKNHIVKFEKGVDAYYFNTMDSLGNYVAYLDTGSYVVTIESPGPYWTVCPPVQTVTIDTGYNLQTLNWTIEPSILCPLLQVDLSAPFLRMTGGGSAYTVSYCNAGTAMANNAYVEVELDPFLNVLSTSVPIASQVNNTYTFNLGDIPENYCSSFDIQVIVDTTATFQQTHCSEAHIYPDSICDPTIWAGARLVVEANCANDSVMFTITNNGAAMAQALDYYVFEDNIMMLQTPFTLGAGQTMNITRAAEEGHTYRLSATQETGYPAILGDPLATAVSEGCNPRSDGTFNTGFVTQFSNGNSSPFIAVDCQENVASYDPNDKAAQPVGYDTQHYIFANTDLDYKIRFQNTGTDTAFNIVILDTISPYLDLSTLQMGASSHSYTWTIVDGNVLKVSFLDIKLVDSVANEPLSHGFFRYNIEQRSNNPLGAEIYNSASIYFDYNPPIKTNTTWHTIGENFVLVSVDKVYQEQANVKVYPNPFLTTTTIEIEGETYNDLELELFDLSGRMVRQVLGGNNKIELHRSGLTQGMYLYTLKNEGKLLHTGKVVVQ